MVFVNWLVAECKALWVAMAGRRTYIVAWLVMAAALVLSFTGKLTPQLTYTVALCALGLFAVTFRMAFAAHSAQVLQALTDAAVLGAAVRSKNRAQELQAAGAVAEDALALDTVFAEKQPVTSGQLPVAQQTGAAS